jgi:hypothetical protein
VNTPQQQWWFAWTLARAHERGESVGPDTYTPEALECMRAKRHPDRLAHKAMARVRWQKLGAAIQHEVKCRFYTRARTQRPSLDESDEVQIGEGRLEPLDYSDLRLALEPLREARR